MICFFLQDPGNKQCDDNLSKHQINADTSNEISTSSPHESSHSGKDLQTDSSSLTVYKESSEALHSHGNDDNPRRDLPHDEARCERCQQLGRICYNYTDKDDQYYDEYEDRIQPNASGPEERRSIMGGEETSICNQCIALYNYEAQIPEDLTFQKGTLLCV